MQLEYSQDENTIHQVFESFFRSECPSEVVRRAEPLGFSRQLWDDLGLTGAVGMALPSACGGGGASLSQLGVVVWLAGAHLAPVPLVEHSVAGRLLSRLRPPRTSALLESLASGSSIATLALRPTEGAACRARFLPAGAVANVVLSLQPGSGGSGDAGDDTDGDDAGSGGSEQLTATISPAPMVALPNTACMPMADRDLAGAPSQSAHRSHTLATGQPASASFARALSEWKALTATALCGLSQQALQIAVDYCQQRHQFDRPIASFQSIQHGLADAATQTEAAFYMAQRALWMLDNDQPEADTHAAMAFLFASETAQQTTAAALHYHGGFGYAEEYDIGLYHLRARGWSQIYDSPDSEYQRLADVLL